MFNDNKHITIQGHVQVLTNICIIVPISAYFTELPIMYKNGHELLMYECFYGDSFFLWKYIYIYMYVRGPF